MPYEAILPALAKAVAGWFPELGGRALAVSEVDPFSDKTNIPILPLALVALINETGTQQSAGSGRIMIEDDLLLQFVFETVKYRSGDGAETPFFAFYNYEGYRDRLLHELRNWRTPRGGAISYRSLDVESDEYAVYLTFRLRTNETWCYTPEEDVTVPVVDIVAQLLYPRADCCPDADCPEDVDPCQAARDQNPYGN